ncbi:MAG TPA: hypothetical protein VFH61_16325, partial [Thermoleophilia bacterium]|nr:hypothetical protein [Thermoleophilia bacterium]
SHELVQLRSSIAELRGDLITAREEEELRDPQEAWQAVGDASKMGSRLDRFKRVWVVKIEDAAAREEFAADVTAIKERIQTIAQMSNEEAFALFRAKFANRADKETDEWKRSWLESQVRMIDENDLSTLQSYLDMYRRSDTVMQLKRLADKYRIDQFDMQRNGLLMNGFAVEWD